MDSQISIGDLATTSGPLKPSGKICIGDKAFDAATQGDWIGDGTPVVIVGGDSRRVIVRIYNEGANPPPDHGKPLQKAKANESTLLEFPLAWVERINAELLGGIMGFVMIPLAWISETPITIEALLLPFAGAVAGWLFRGSVGTALKSAGPREDHRPVAVLIAFFVVVCSLAGSAMGLAVLGGFWGLSLGLAIGALLGSVITRLGMAFSGV